MSYLRALVLTRVIAPALGTPAHAAKGGVMGQGGARGGAIAAAGTGHIAYNADYPDALNQPVMYCSWPRGARTCAPRPITADGDSAQAQPALVQAGPAPGEVTVVSSRRSL